MKTPFSAAVEKTPFAATTAMIRLWARLATIRFTAARAMIRSGVVLAVTVSGAAMAKMSSFTSPIKLLSGQVDNVESAGPDIVFTIGTGKIILDNAAGTYAKVVDSNGNTLKEYFPRTSG